MGVSRLRDVEVVVDAFTYQTFVGRFLGEDPSGEIQDEESLVYL